MAGQKDTLGKVLSIPDDVTKKIGKVVAGINQIEKAANSMASSVSAAYKELGGSGLNAFMRQVAKATKTMQSNKIVDVAPIKEATSETEKLANAVSKVAQSASKFSSPIVADKELSNTLARYNALKKQVEEFERKKASGRDTKLDDIRTTKAKEELRILEAKIPVLQANANWAKKSSEAFREQIAHLSGMSLPLQKSKQTLAEYAKYYKELAKEQEKLAKEEEKRAKDQLRAQEKLAKEESRRIAQATKEQEKLARIREKESEREANKMMATPQGALYSAGISESYSQKVQALKNLETAYKNLGKTDADVAMKAKLAEKMRELRKEIATADKEMGRMQGPMRGLLDWGSQLTRAFALVFSVSQIRNYVTELARVRGEFELQQTALGAMLDNKEKANELFGQITQLAVKSPFTLKQLFSYTKQLAAYGFEEEKLYDTTKRLADVSAGLGVDMGRLALALGQVKSANYLRGTETRQFTEAGFNILKELANYYSELEGRLVSVGEVQARVTKRMVSFGDVETVFERVTSAGGKFYDIQAKIADTLLGQMSNLRDRLDLMMNEIGESNEGLLKGFVKILQSLVENWELVAVAIQMAVPALIGWKINSLLANKNTDLLSDATTSLSSAMATVKTEGLIKGFGKLFGVGGYIAVALIAIEGLIALYNRWSDSAERTREELEKYNSVSGTIKSAVIAYDKLNESLSNADKNDKDFAKRTYDLKKKSLQDLAKSLKDFGYKGNIDFSGVNSDNIDEFKNKLVESANAFAVFGREWADVIGDMSNGLELFGLIGENIKSDAEDLNESASDMAYSVSKEVDIVRNAIINSKEILDELDPKLFDSIISGLAPQKEGENIVDYYNRINGVMIELAESNGRYFDRTGREIIGLTNSLPNLLNAYTELNTDLGRYEHEINKALNKIQRRYYSSREQMQEYAKSHPVEFMAQFNSAIAEAEITGFAAEWANYKIPILLDFTLPEDVKESGLADWQQEILDWQSSKGLNLFSDDSIKQMHSTNDFIDKVVSKYKEADDWLKKYTSHTGSLTKQQKAQYDKLTKSEKQRFEAQKKAAQEFASQYGINLQTAKQMAKAESQELKNFKELVSIIRKANKEYEQMLNVKGKAQSANEIGSSYKELISKLASDVGLDGATFVSTMSFDTSGIEKALGTVAQRAADIGNKDAKLVAETAIAELQNEEFILKVKLKIEEAGRAIEDAFGKLQLGEEFKKLGLKENIIERVFGIGTFSISDVRSKLTGLANELKDENGDLGKNQSDFIEKWTKKLQDEERKVWINTFKEYSKYLKSGVSEAVKIRLEEASALEAINRLQQSNFKLTEAEIELMKQGVKRDTEKKLAGADWDVFTNTPLYIRLFEDLESASTGALESMKSKLDGMKYSLGSLSPEVLKSIMDQYNQLEDQLIRRAPFKSLIKSLKEVNELKRKGLTLDDLTLQLEEQQEALRTLELDRAKAQEDISLGLDPDKSIEELDKLIVTKKKDIQTTLDQMDAYGKVNKSLQATSQRMSLISQIGNQFLDSTTAAIEAFGGDVDDSTKAVTDFLGSMLNLVTQIPFFVSSIIAAGLQINSALGIIGLIAMAVQALVAAFTMFSKIHDNKNEKQIERELELIDALGKKYEKLEKQIENAYSMNTYEKSVDDAIINLQKQNDALSRAIAAESENKNVDEERIKEWREQQQKNLETIEELKEKTLEAYGGFGTGDNIKSAAEDFASAWVDAFNETGDGLSGLEEQMDQFLDNAIKKQLLMRLSEEFITPLISQFDEMFKEYSDGGRGLTKKELDAWKRLYEKNSKEFDEKAKAYMDALGITPTGMDSELSGLQRGIQGVTETTAQALEALLNSIRYYTSDTNSMIRQLYSAIISPDESVNPMLAELRSQTMWLHSIHELIKSSTKNVGVNGNAMKVVIV